MIDLKESFREFIDEEELDDFLVWSFGADWDFIENGGQMVQAWNDRHYHEFQIQLNSSLGKDVAEMIEIWHNRD